jgi:hypothetical protein
VASHSLVVIQRALQLISNFSPKPSTRVSLDDEALVVLEAVDLFVA